MIKYSIYPKTPRVDINMQYQITEKLDGATLGIGKYDGKVYIFLKNNILCEDEIDTYKNILYKDLYSYIKENLDDLRCNLHDNTIVFGEWIGMGNIKYDNFNKYYLFAKAKIVNLKYDTGEISLDYMNYEIDKLMYAFKYFLIPHYMNTVPVVGVGSYNIGKLTLDSLYEEYVSKVGRQVEGFVIYNEMFKQPMKYIRLKRGKLQEHFTHNKKSGEVKCNY